MPANPGKNRSAEKQKKKRAAAQQARKARTVAQKARDARLAAAAETEVPEGAAPHPFAESGEVDYDALDEANEEIAKLIKKKSFDDAEKKARELADRFPRHSDGLQRLAEIHERRGDKKKALEVLREAVKRPNDGDEEVTAEIEGAIRRLGG
ncbi:MAG: hypothetical protein HYV09_02895 [Deltaproteobacteria bacterium]|nr:hypothetical protein [Deltaproteobacteria bacterium]